MAQFRAQLHEEAMVEVLVGFAQDMNLAPSLRRDCARDVIAIARGPLAPVGAPNGETIDPSVAREGGGTVGDEIVAIRATAELYQRLDELVRREVPPELWPEDVRAIAGNLAASYAEDDA